MFFQLFFLTDVAGLNPAYAAWAVGIRRIWDAINDPLFGLVSDRIRTTLGPAAGAAAASARCRWG